MQIQVSNIEKCEKILSKISKYISPSGKDRTRFNNFFMFELSVEILTNQISITGYNYDESRLIINKSLTRFVHYKIHSLSYFKRAIEYTVNRQNENGWEPRYLISFVPRNLIRNLDLPSEFLLLSRKMTISKWKFVTENFEFNKFLSNSPSRFNFDSVTHRFIPIILETFPNNPILGLNKVNQPFALFRAIVNFSLNVGKFPNQPNLPLNNFRPSPVTIIFQENKEYLIYYYNFGDYKIPHFSFVKEPEKRLVHSLLRYFKIPLHSKYRTFLAEALIKYSTAGDSIDWDSVFMALWINLERVAFPLGESRVRDVPNRIARFVNIGDHTKDLLIILKRFRNNLFHKGEFTDFDSSPAIFLKVLVEIILMELIRNQWHAHDLVELDYVHQLNKERDNFEKLYSFIDKFSKTI